MEKAEKQDLEQLRARAEELSARLVAEAKAAGATVATAESLTAGLVAATIADTPGASAVLRGGVVVYATELKVVLAGVDEDLLRRKGAVDPEVARQLAAGAASRCSATIGVGLTGVAGPDMQDGHPVGDVFLVVAAPAEFGGSQVRHLSLGTQPRPVIRQLAVNNALELILDVLGSGNK